MEIEKPKESKCDICNMADPYRVCVKCDAIVSARKVYKRNFIFKDLIEMKYTGIVFHNKSIKADEKPAEISKIMNSFTVVKKIKDYERDSKARETNIGMDGLNLEERQKFFTVYHGHYKRLEDNQEYAMKKIGYDSERRVFFIKDMDFYNQLKFENQVKDNARIN